ncbi:MAG: DegV family protein [Butyrivibrio sp.]|nr:DegV family protein [Butyrivibrio sp.]
MVKIIADSTCDLSRDIIEKYDITIIPLSIIMGDKSYYDGLDITPEEIYKWADENRTTPKTAAVSADMVRDILGKFKEREVIFFGISSKMSSTCDVVRSAAAEEGFDNVKVVDSRNLSTGIGLQVVRACELARAGCTQSEIIEAVSGERDKVSASFVVDTLTYLARGGRCGQATALIGNMLGLKPEIVVKDGEMHVGKKYRGTLSKVILKYVKDMEQDLVNADPRLIFITHSGCKPEIVSKVREYLVGLGHFTNIAETRAGGVISSHCGPGTLGVLYYREEKNEQTC